MSGKENMKSTDTESNANQTDKTSSTQDADVSDQENPLILKGEKIELSTLDTSLGYFLWERLQKHGNKILQVDACTGERVTALELHWRALSVANALRARTLPDSAVVAAALDNGPPASYALLGTLYAEVAFAPLNPDLSIDDLRHALSLLQPHIIFCEGRHIRNLKTALVTDAELIEVDNPSREWVKITDLHSFHGPPQYKPGGRVRDLDAAAVIMCSSGTTGPPKGVVFSHKVMHHIVLTREALSKRSDSAGTEPEVTLVANPFAWVSGLVPTLASAASGWLLLQFARFDVERVLGAVEKYRVTAVTLASPLVSAIARHPRSMAYDASAVALFRFGGSRLSPYVRQVAETNIKKKLIYHYGLTECPWPVMAGPMSEQKGDTVGVVAPNTWIKIIEMCTGRILGPLEEGEICIKSPLMFTCYYKDPKATEEALDADGWLHTGDVGLYDEDRYIYVVDRFKELIKYQGIHVAPADIENVLLKHPCVLDAAVVGVDDDEDTEHAVAFVVVDPGHFVSGEELMQLVRDELPSYKHLHGGVYFGTEIPRTAAGKIKRRDLRKVARAKRDHKTKTDESINRDVEEPCNIEQDYKFGADYKRSHSISFHRLDRQRTVSSVHSDRKMRRSSSSKLERERKSESKDLPERKTQPASIMKRTRERSSSTRLQEERRLTNTSTGPELKFRNGVDEKTDRDSKAYSGRERKYSVDVSRNVDTLSKTSIQTEEKRASKERKQSIDVPQNADKSKTNIQTGQNVAPDERKQSIDVSQNADKSKTNIRMGQNAETSEKKLSVDVPQNADKSKTNIQMGQNAEASEKKLSIDVPQTADKSKTNIRMGQNAPTNEKKQSLDVPQTADKSKTNIRMGQNAETSERKQSTEVSQNTDKSKTNLQTEQNAATRERKQSVDVSRNSGQVSKTNTEREQK